LLFLLIGTAFTLVMPKKYTSKSKLLVVQGVSKEFDLYSVSKSNSFLSKVLANVVESNSFYVQTMNSGFDIDKSYFTADPDKQAKVWAKTVQAGTVEDSGIINIAVTHVSQYQADQIAKAVNDSLKKTHSQYHGAGESVQIKTIDQPFTSKFPVKPNFYLNYLLSFAFGLMTALTFIYLFQDEKYDIIFLPGNRSKKITENEVYDFAVEEETDHVRIDQPEPEKSFENREAYSREQAENFQEKSNFGQNYDNIDDLAYEEVVKRGRMENLINA
jgi:capsular polysaccharide biosynthesis protein